MILVGIDEAGYGPTLGPLVVSAAAFRIAPPQRRGPASSPLSAETSGLDLWEALARVVTRKPDRRRIPVNDSKKIYRPGKGLAALEEGVLPFLHLRENGIPKDLRGLLQSLRRARQSADYLDQYPWYCGCTIKVPTGTYGNYIRVLAGRLQSELREANVEFLGLASSPIEVMQFNQALARHNNKALVPFIAVASLLSRVWKSYPDESVDAIIDRQGGRIKYAPLLYRALKPRGVRIECQTVDRSVYHLRRGPKSVLKVTFTRQGDSKSFPVALASMVSKYLRELHMLAFNQYWKNHRTDLRPTAGYPTDARRFLSETAELRSRLGIEDGLLIRRR